MEQKTEQTGGMISLAEQKTAERIAEVSALEDVTREQEQREQLDLYWRRR